MDWHIGMSQAIDYIESNLTADVNPAVAARYTGCSSWEFQRIFSFLAHLSLGEYIRRRRLSLAAEELRHGQQKIIDIALKYGYESPAAFSRAFGQWHGIAPSSARKAGVSLRCWPRITFETDNRERNMKMSERNDMERYAQRGYYVKENAPVYFTEDMDKTCQWFRDILGWYGDIVARDAAGKGDYGCVFDYPGELIVAHLTPFRGIHLFHGQPVKGVVGFLQVQGLDKLHAYIRSNGWQQITDISNQPWGARECAVTTIDGCLLRFFETE